MLRYASAGAEDAEASFLQRSASVQRLVQEMAEDVFGSFESLRGYFWRWAKILADPDPELELPLFGDADNARPTMRGSVSMS